MKCPTCHRPITWEENPYRPFCSERCKLIDFGAWANEEFKVPAEEAAPSFEDGERQPAADEDTDRLPRP